MAPTISATPQPDVTIDSTLVKTLLESQHPDLLGLNIQFVESGWDNAMIRLGSDIALRLPRRAVADPLLLNEQLWLPRLAPLLPLTVPAPLRCGKPSATYPFHWSVLHWLPGKAADVSPPASGEAPRFARFLRALHSLEFDTDLPKNPVRDCPLTDKQVDTETRLKLLSSKTNWVSPQVLNAWRAALAAGLDLPRVLIHGDLHSRNVLVVGGQLSAVIDWGDMCGGDPATDLAAIWCLFEDASARARALEAYQATALTRARAIGWAIVFGSILAVTGMEDSPRHAAIGEAVLKRVHEDASL